MKKRATKNTYLFISVLILFVLYIFSFSKNNTSKDKRKPVKTALVNSKYENTISKFTFIKNGDFLYLQKKNDLWLVSKKNDETFFIPADNTKVEEFIKDLTKVVDLYKISDSLPHNNNFGFTGNDCFTLFYDDINELQFGAYDFTKTARYLMTGKNTKVYEISNDLDKYLTVSIQNWCDPLIISQNILKIKPEDIQSITVIENGKTKKINPDSINYQNNVSKLLELRHGGAAELKNVFDEPCLQLLLECGDSSAIFMEFYNTASESEYNLKCTYKKGFTNKTVSFEYKMSLWTYNKIKEIML